MIVTSCTNKIKLNNNYLRAFLKYYKIVKV